MVARATSAQPFLRALPHPLLRLVPPSAGRPRCAALRFPLPSPTRNAFFRQVRHEKSTAKAVPYRGGPARATSAQSFLRTLPHTLLRLVPPSAGRPRCAAPPSQLPVSTRSAFFRQVRHEKSTAKAVPYRGGPARARTAVLQSSSADTTRLVCDQISPAGSPQTTCSLGTLP